MKKNLKIFLAVIVVGTGCTVFAAPPRGHHHHERDGLDIANGIVDLVLRVLAPRPVVVAPQPVAVAPPPPPVVVAPQPVVVAPPPRYEYRRPAPPRHHNPPRKPNGGEPRGGGHRR